jgi:hypothetical protein
MLLEYCFHTTFKPTTEKKIQLNPDSPGVPNFFVPKDILESSGQSGRHQPINIRADKYEYMDTK